MDKGSEALASLHRLQQGILEGIDGMVAAVLSTPELLAKYAASMKAYQRAVATAEMKRIQDGHRLLDPELDALAQEWSRKADEARATLSPGEVICFVEEMDRVKVAEGIRGSVAKAYASAGVPEPPAGAGGAGAASKSGCLVLVAAGLAAGLAGLAGAALLA